MRRIIVIALMCVCASSVKAQTNPFPNTDSLIRYVNRWIRNSPVEAFQNLRMNTSLIGIIRFIESAAGGGGAVDTMYSINDSTLRLVTDLGTFTTVIRGAKDVDSMYKSGDSLVFTLNGARYALPLASPFILYNALGGVGDTLVNSDKEVKWLNPGDGILHTITGTTITQRVDSSKYATQYDLTQVTGGPGGADTSDYTKRPHLGLIAKAVDTIYFFGDSYTDGTGATTTAKRWASLFTQAMGCIEKNYGLNASTLQKRSPVDWLGAANMIDRLTLVPAKAANKKMIVFAFGLNDLGEQGANYIPANYKLDYDSVLNYVINTKGWNPSQILLVPPYWIGTAGYAYYGTLNGGNPDPTYAEHLEYVQATKEIAAQWGTMYIDIYKDQLLNDTTLLAGVGTLHPNDSGYAFIAQDITQYLARNVAGQGTATFIPKFLQPSVLGNSGMYDNGTYIISNLPIAAGGPNAGFVTKNYSDGTDQFKLFSGSSSLDIYDLINAETVGRYFRGGNYNMPLAASHFTIGSADQSTYNFQVTGTSNAFNIIGQAHIMGNGAFPYGALHLHQQSDQAQAWTFYSPSGTLLWRNAAASDIFGFSQTGQVVINGNSFTATEALKVNGRVHVTDTGRLDARFSYNSNIHGSFTSYSLVDKAWVDSLLAGIGAATTIYNGDGTLTSNRTVTLSTFNLTFAQTSTGKIKINGLNTATGAYQFVTHNTDSSLTQLDKNGLVLDSMTVGGLRLSQRGFSSSPSMSSANYITFQPASGFLLLESVNTNTPYIQMSGRPSDGITRTYSGIISGQNQRAPNTERQHFLITTEGNSITSNFLAGNIIIRPGTASSIGTTGTQYTNDSVVVDLNGTGKLVVDGGGGLAILGQGVASTPFTVQVKGTDSVVKQVPESALTVAPTFAVVTSDPTDWTAAVSTFTTLPDLTGAGGSKVLTLPSAAANAGKTIQLWNTNTSVTNTWSFAAAVTTPAGTTTSVMVNGTYIEVFSTGSIWFRKFSL